MHDFFYPETDISLMQYERDVLDTSSQSQSDMEYEYDIEDTTCDTK